MLRSLGANLDLKVISVLIAAALWWFVATTDTTPVAIAAAVEYTGLADDRAVVGPEGQRVEVQLQAVRSVVARLSADRVRVLVNLAGFGEGRSVVDLKPEDVMVPPGVVVTRVTPSRLHLTIAPVDGTRPERKAPHR